MKLCWSAKPRNRPSFKHIIMHIEIAANELVNFAPDMFYNLQKEWKEEIANSLLRMKRNGRQDISTDDEQELINKRKQELVHAQDIREHYERKLSRANELYMELSACMLQLEQKEKELLRREQCIMGKSSKGKAIVGPMLQAAHERMSSSRRGSYRPDRQMELQSPIKNGNEAISCHTGSARSRIKRSRQRRSIGHQTSANNQSHTSINSPLNNPSYSYSPRPSPLQERKSFVDTETQTDYVLTDSDLVSPSSSTLSPMSAMGRVDTAIEMGDNDINNGIIRGIPKTSTTFDSGFGDSCLSTPTARNGSDKSPITPVSGKSSSIETDSEEPNRTKLKGRSTAISQNTVPSLSSIDENGVQFNPTHEETDFCDVAIVRRGSISCQRRFGSALHEYNKSSHKSPPFMNQRPVLQHAGSNISISSRSSSSDEEEGGVDSDDYATHPSPHKRIGSGGRKLAKHMSQHRLSGQSISTLSSDGNKSETDDEGGNTSEYSSNQNDFISSLSNTDLTNANLENANAESEGDIKVSFTQSL